MNRPARSGMSARKAVGAVAPFAAVDLIRPEHEKPLRDLIVRLPQLVTDKQGKLDLLASSPSLVLEVAERAETSVKAINMGHRARWAISFLTRPRKSKTAP